VPVDLLREAGLVGSSEQGRLYDRFRDRLIFPICDPQGRPIAFGGRALGSDPAKYLNSPETPLFSKSRVLYPFDLARRAIEKQRAAIIVEGYMDAVLLHQHGFQHAVATLGTALTDAHVQLMTPLAGTLYMCFDADDAGVRAADRAVEIALRADVDVRVVTLDAGKDPADCLVEFGAERFDEALQGAVDAIDFKWRHTLKHYGDGARGRRAAVEAFIQFIAGATATGHIDPLTHNLVVGRLADVLGVGAEQVFDMLAGARRMRPRAVSEESRESALPGVEDAGERAPTDLAPAVETLLGLLVINPECWRNVDDSLSVACCYYQTWNRLFHVLLDVHANTSEYSISDVVARCDDREVCDLLGRVRTRCEGISDAAAHFEAARRSLATELDALRISGLRSDLSPAGPDTARAHYGSLVSLARAQHGFLPAARRGPAIGALPT
jgi:DNA primase